MAVNINKLIMSIMICEVAGIIGSFAIAGGLDWYALLNKPSFTPPGTYIGMVWVFLYALMGISLYLVCEKHEESVNNDAKRIKSTITIFAIQLAVNTAWSFLFFSMRSVYLGLVGIIVLWILVLITIIKFREISKPAAYLLIPYLLWVTVATYLNYMIWTMNM